MSLIRRILFKRFGPEIGGAGIIQPLFTGLGVFTFLACALYLPKLEPTRVEAIFALLLLAIFTLLCTAVGQLAVIIEKLNARASAEKAKE